jgi:hypothetical protein
MFHLFTLLACAPRYGSLAAMGPEDLHTPMPRQHLEVNGVDIAYVDSGGDKPALVFVHGLSSYTAFWEHQVADLSRDHRVLALDLPGYGGSGRPDAPYSPPWYADVVDGWLGALGVAEGHPRRPLHGRADLHHARAQPPRAGRPALMLSPRPPASRSSSPAPRAG